MATATPIETLEKDIPTNQGFEPRDEIERLLKKLTAKWDEEDFLDMLP